MVHEAASWRRCVNGRGQICSVTNHLILKRFGHSQCVVSLTDGEVLPFSCRHLSIAHRTSSVAILGPENDAVRKDPSWVVK